MQFNHTTAQLADYTAAQVNTFFPDGDTVTGSAIQPYVTAALDRVEHCFQHIAWPAYSMNREARFNLLHSDQYCTYLYFLANSAHRLEASAAVCSKIFYLNKSLHGFNCMYDTELPDIFWLAHTVGTVLGKAQYSNYLAVLQNCTIGALRGVYPKLGERLILSAGASIIGDCTIGDNVLLGPGCTVLKRDIPDNSLVTNNAETVVRANSDRPIKAYFHID
jgi:serine O-acetyltransferase